MYYLLAGRPPFQANSLYDIYQAHISHDASPLNLVRPEVPTELAALVAKMMAKDPARRFQTPGKVASALTSFFKKEGAGFKSINPESSMVGQPIVRQALTVAAPAPPRPAMNAAPPPLPAATTPPPPEPVWQSLIEIRENERSGEKSPPAVVRAQRPPWVRPAVAVGVLLLGLIVLWGLVIRVKTTNGTIELVNLPRDAEVFVDGAEIAVTRPSSGKPAVITVSAGKRGIEVRKDGIRVFGQEVTVQAGGDPLTVRLMPLTDSGSKTVEVVKNEAERKEKVPVPGIKGEAEPKSETPAPPAEPEFLTTSIGGGQLKLKRIPAGTFRMGSTDADRDAWDGEKPRHEVRITRPFYLGVYEVTQGQFQAVMGENPSYFKGSDNLPVEQVSWLQAVTFCNRLSEREGLKPYYRIEGETVAVTGGDGYRLPTEAEWEYACRAGTTTRFSFGDDENALGQYAWYSANSNGRPHPVGEKHPNALGLHDMHGNVSEWCWDAYNAEYYKQSPTNDPQGPDRASDRARRAGGWSLEPRLDRSAFRWWGAPGFRAYDLGFRLARELPRGRTTFTRSRSLKRMAEVASGSWRIEGEELVQTSRDGPAALVFGDPSWSNYNLELDMKPIEGISGTWTFFHYRDWSNHCNFYIGGFGNTIHGVGTVLDGECRREHTDGSIEHLRWYKVNIEVRGPEARCYLDGRAILHHVDDRLTVGRVGLGSNWTEVHFRNIRITSLDGEVLWEGLPELP